MEGQKPLVVHLPHEFICTTKDIDVATIEWQYRFFSFAFTLKSANNVTELRLQHTPTTTGMYSYYCVVTTSAGVKIEVEEPFHVYGTSRKLLIKMITFISTVIKN